MLGSFEFLTIKNEVYLTLKNKSLYSLYSIVKDDFLETVRLQSLVEPKSYN